ncbi:hypothetical protein RHGRI_037379 [Rhododendron griersonianum]|uniref:Uncharacterized protein n=1 Tax=Rhododendron griersonianum TaxID=479676 RepID=A0AAV6HV76_9ERIC|nr:hypothetical protein RHGRI_037379 [Rhododendron griersonianum]
MDPTESWDSKSMDIRNGFANVKGYNVSTQSGVKEDDGELSGSMYVQTTDTLGTASKGLNSQQLLQDNGQSKGINLMVDLNISQGMIEGDVGKRRDGGSVQKLFDLGCTSQREEYVISNGDVEEVEGLHRQNLKDGSNAPGDRASFDAILKMRIKIRKSERKIKKKGILRRLRLSLIK